MRQAFCKSLYLLYDTLRDITNSFALTISGRVDSKYQLDKLNRTEYFSMYTVFSYILYINNLYALYIPLPIVWLVDFPMI